MFTQQICLKIKKNEHSSEEMLCTTTTKTKKMKKISACEFVEKTYNQNKILYLRHTYWHCRCDKHALNKEGDKRTTKLLENTEMFRDYDNDKKDW